MSGRPPFASIAKITVQQAMQRISSRLAASGKMRYAISTHDFRHYFTVKLHRERRMCMHITAVVGGATMATDSWATGPRRTVMYRGTEWGGWIVLSRQGAYFKRGQVVNVSHKMIVPKGFRFVRPQPDDLGTVVATGQDMRYLSEQFLQRSPINHYPTFGYLSV